MRRWWPGPLTLVLYAKGGGTLGVRIPKHKVALALLRTAGPLMTTSANLHGREPAMSAEEAGALSQSPFSIGHIAIGAALSYIDFRFPELAWRKDIQGFPQDRRGLRSVAASNRPMAASAILPSTWPVASRRSVLVAPPAAGPGAVEQVHEHVGDEVVDSIR